MLSDCKGRGRQRSSPSGWGYSGRDIVCRAGWGRRAAKVCRLPCEVGTATSGRQTSSRLLVVNSPSGAQRGALRCGERVVWTLYELPFRPVFDVVANSRIDGA
jgi:hypothetical protein